MEEQSQLVNNIVRACRDIPNDVDLISAAEIVINGPLPGHYWHDLPSFPETKKT